MTIYCAGNMLVDIFHIGYILLFPVLKYADYCVINELESPSLAKLILRYYGMLLDGCSLTELIAEAGNVKHATMPAVV